MTPADEVFHYILTDNDGDKAGADIVVSVTPAGYVAPLETADLAFNGAEDSYQHIYFSVAEDSAPAHGFVLDTLPQESVGHLQIFDGNGEVDVQTGVEYSANASVYFIGAGDWNGTATFQYHAVGFDGSVDDTPGTITLNWEARNDAPTGGVAIDGLAKEGERLTIDTSSLQDADGLGSLSYQWLRDGDEGPSPIVGAVDSEYILTSEDVGHHISVGVNYTDGGGTVESVASAATGAVDADDPPPSNNLPSPADDHIIMASDNMYFGPGGERYIVFPFDFLAVNDDPDGGDIFTSAYNVNNSAFSAPTVPGASVGLGPGGVFYQLASGQTAPFEDSFTYDISNDGHGNATGNPATVTLSVTNSRTLAGDADSARSDIIVGGLFSETMTGHGGADGFVFLPAPGRDTITDFTPGVDKIVIANFDPSVDLQFSGMSELEAAFLLNPNENTFDAWKADWTIDDNSVTFALHYDSFGTATDTVTLASVDPFNLHASDFIVHNIVANA